MTKSLFDYTNEFRLRHNGPRQPEVDHMLEAIGVSTLDQLISDTIPKAIVHDKTLGLDRALSESEYLKKIKDVASKNAVFKSYIGMGYYPCKVPSVILRNVLENPGWYTQYTPYQAEISQGRLEMLLNFQTMVSDLTGMEISNSSLLDEGTAAAEAMTMAYRVKPRSKKRAETIFISYRCHPQTIDVVKTRALPLGINVVIGDEQTLEFTDDLYAVLVQYPDTHGNVFDLSALSAKAKENDVLMIFAADLLALTVLKSPAELGADIVVGSAQRFGVPMGYGGPHAAFMATKDEFKRQIPGRIIGVSIDAEGNKAYRMALQTREQHIRREKATSNICTAQALLANMAAMYAIYHGAAGLKLIANRIHRLATLFVKHIKDLGFTVDTASYFDTITISGVDSRALRGLAEAAKVNLAYIADGQVSVSFHEQAQLEDVEELVNLFAKSARKKATFSPENFEKSGFADSLKRTGDILVHEVFSMYRSETEMMRYLKRLENKDLSLTTSMIPLGSCTMKLNAATEMIPITWPEFGELHPFAPITQARGYHQLFVELETMLFKITKFSGVSLQPNAGAQGEYSGLLVIKKYHESRDDHARNLVLIPASAHGTNPASAVLAGMDVVVTKTDELGNIDLVDLREKAEKHRDRLAALMVTYPSTHGVFEESIVDVCKIIHENGGQVYMDGANMNAQVGITSPGFIGADVCHLNLHKTFCIPHGGGGPGMGPICVAEHLRPFLPSHPVVPVHNDPRQMGTVSAAPWGSASILLISHAYISMMGEYGLIDATKMAILNANYIKARLEKHYPVLYKGENGHVAHEMIFDCREFKRTANIEVEDIAKRLMDYGFHAPTVSFPVAGTLMVEPTESESLAELDRFCEAMIGIREEIRRIENGQLDKNENMLKYAPHTMAAVTQNDWARPYSREEAAFPAPWLKDYKYWPATARVNNAHGDRELICTCPPIEMFEN